MKNKDFERGFQQIFKQKLSNQLFKHRQQGKLSQFYVADVLGTSRRTYQRWESSGDCLTNIFTLLRVFQVLDFSTPEIIDVLGLPPLTLSEIEAIYQDEDILKSISGNAIYSAMREKCPDIDGFTLEKLYELIMKERKKRLESRRGNP